jgi:hypothetical protein
MTPTCTCPTKFDENGAVVRAYMDAACPVHAKPAGVQHCPTCRCGEVPIVQTPETAAKLAKDGRP